MSFFLENSYSYITFFSNSDFFARCCSDIFVPDLRRAITDFTIRIANCKCCRSRSKVIYNAFWCSLYLIRLNEDARVNSQCFRATFSFSHSFPYSTRLVNNLSILIEADFGLISVLFTFRTCGLNATDRNQNTVWRRGLNSDADSRAAIDCRLSSDFSNSTFRRRTYAQAIIFLNLALALLRVRLRRLAEEYRIIFIDLDFSSFALYPVFHLGYPDSDPYLALTLSSTKGRFPLNRLL